MFDSLDVFVCVELTELDPEYESCGLNEADGLFDTDTVLLILDVMECEDVTLGDPEELPETELEGVSE